MEQKQQVEVDILKDKLTKIEIDSNRTVELIDCMPRLIDSKKLSGDYVIAENARISYGNNTIIKTNDEDRNLIRYLIENYHTSPLECVKFKFLIQDSIFTIRQLLRHRTFNINEYSMRYSKAIDSFAYPELRLQDTENKQGSLEGKIADISDSSVQLYEEAKKLNSRVFEIYNELIKNGIAREVARSILPTAEVTRLYVCADLHNLLKFLRLRMDPHAQKEIRDLANAMYKLIYPLFPVSCDAFKDFWFDSVTLSKPEQQIITGLSLRGSFRELGGKLDEKEKIRPRQLKAIKRKLDALGVHLE